MKRLRFHVAVEDLQQSLGFISALFTMQLAVIKDDYAKWRLDDSRLNFASALFELPTEQKKAKSKSRA